jgi:predicted metal-dependent hydrolase
MNTKAMKLQVSNLMINTIKKDIKNIHLGVYPPNGNVRVSAPLETPDDVIRLFVMSKMHWIKTQQIKFLEQERQPLREYVTGESHYFFGIRYRLNIVYTDMQPKLEIRNKSYLDLYVRSSTTISQREEIFEKFYRSEVKKLVPSVLERWQRKLGIQAKGVSIKKMKTKWGTCNSNDKRIWLNLELAKKPLHCIEYVFVHELIHLIEKSHSKRFIQLLETALPHWRRTREELNSFALGYFTWDCEAHQ